MSETAVPRPLPAVLLNRYRLGPEIGRGGASVVLRAHDGLLARDVAIKVFTARASDPGDLRTQEAEARMLAGLSHHGLVTLLDAGIDLTNPDAPQVFLVLELIEDADLRQRLRSGPLGPVDVAYLGFDLAGAIAYVHRHGVIHRDIKPANVLLSGTGTQRVRGKLADFGIAMLRGTDVPQEQTTGTAAYLSPEQVEGEPLTPASDVYSLGLVLLEALTATPAFSGTVVDTALARLERDPRVPASIPGPLATLLVAMTARVPADRPSPDEVEDELRAFLIDAISRPARDVGREETRLAALRRYDLLDTPPDGAFDRVTALAARLSGCPIALVGLADADRIWFKSTVGIDARQVPRTPGSAVLERTIVVEEVTPTAAGRPPTLAAALGVRFFAGVPLVTGDGLAIGMLAVADHRSRTVTADQVAALEDLAALVLHEMELRIAVRRAVGRT